MADGNLEFDTKIDDTDFEKKIKSMDSSVEGLKSIIKTLSGYMEKVFNNKSSDSTTQAVDNTSSKMMSLNEQLRKAEIELENAKKKMQDFASQQIPTEEYAAAEREAGKLEQKLLSLLDRKERFEETGGNTSSKTYQQMQYDIDTVEKKLESAEAEMCRLNEEGKRFKVNDKAEFEKLSNGVTTAQSKVDILKQKMSELSAKEKETGKSGTSMFQKMSGATQTLSNKLFKATKSSAAMGSTLAKNVNPAPKMISGVSKKIDTLGKKLAGMVKRVFVFSMMTKALRAMRTAMQGVISSDKDMSSSLAQIKGNLLTAFAPLYSFVLPAIKAALSALVTFTNYLANVMSSIFGKTISQSKALAQEINKNSQATDKNTKSTKKNNKEKERQLSGLDQMNRWSSDKDSDKDEGSSTAPMFNATEMNVDWVDKIKNMMASGNWEGIGEFLANKLNDSLKKIPWGKIQNTAKSIATKLARMLNGFFSVMDLASTLGNTVAQALNTGLMFAYTFLTTFNFGQFGTFIGTSINSFIKNFQWGLLGDTLGSAVQGAIDTAYGFVTTYEWGSFASGIADSINHLLKGINFKKLATTISKAVAGIITEISNFIAGIDWGQIGKDILDFLSGIDWKGIFISLIGVVKSVIGGVDGFLTGIFGKGGATTIEAIAIAIGTLVAALKLYNLALQFNNIQTAIAEAKAKLMAIAQAALNAVMAINPVFLVVAAIMALIAVFVLLWNKCEGFREFWINLWEGIKEVAGVVWESIKEFFVSAWDNIKSVWNKACGFFRKIWDGIKKIFAPVAKYFKNIFKNAWDYVKSIFSTFTEFFNGLIGGVKKIFSGFTDFITGIFTGNWKKAWEGVKKIFKGVWDTFYAIVKLPINLIIDGVNFLWKNIYNAISSIVNTVGEVAGALGDIFGQDWHFKMPDDPPTIPHLAKGAVIPPRSEFMAVLGDQKHGTNIETPENLLRQIMREELGKINTSGSGTYEFTAQINRRTLFDEVIKEGKLRKKTTGRNAFQF